MVNSKQLLELDSRIKIFATKFDNSPNVFEVVKVSNKEIVHSNMLSWLLDPNMKLGIGCLFLKQLIKKLSERYGHNQTIIQLNKLPDHDLFHSEVLREKLRTDILINFNNSKIIIVIENKILSSEHDDQLNKYQNSVEKNYGKKYQYLYLYLTPEGLQPKNSLDWLPISYYEINEILNSIKTETNHYEFINSYQRILEDKILKKGPLVKEALSIYKNNRQTFDFIMNLIDKKVISSDFIQDQLNDSLGKHNLKFLRGSNKYINFTINGISKYLGNFGDGTWIKDYPQEYFSLEFVLEWNKDDLLKVRIKAVVGPTINENLKKLSRFLIKNYNGLFKLKGNFGHKRHTTVFSHIIYTSNTDVFDHEDFEKNIKLYFQNEFGQTISRFNDYFTKFGKELEKELLKN